MNDLLRFLIPKVNAQTADAVAQPTFGPIDLNQGGNSINATVLLTSEKTSVKVGDRFKVRVEIKTNAVQITEYRIVLDFNPSLLSVVDEDSNTEGTQIKLLDTVFKVSNPAQDNLVTNVGRARLIAKAPAGTGLTVNTEVVEIQFQAQAVGSSQIQIVEGTTGTALVKSNALGQTFTSNEVTIQNVVQTGGTTGSTTTNGGGTTTGGTTTNGTTTGGTTGGTIPDTAIGDNLVVLIPLIIALLSVTLGISLKKSNSKKSSKSP